MLKIEKRSDGQTTTIHLSGRIQSEHLEELQAQIRCCAHETRLDMEEVTLVDRAVVRYLSLCRENGIELLNCSLYIEEWIRREKSKDPR
jgi:anti-anti-sigma regulatory factor